MGGRRVALLVATDRYQDSGLSGLTAPANDAKKLAAVLSDPAIAGFEVLQLLKNKPNHVVGKAIGDFYRACGRDDLTLLYFTGHGIKDDYGQLYLAMTDTYRDNLQFTGLHGGQIRLAMQECRSKQNVLVLDCCYAGAFPAGSSVKGDATVHALEQLGGRGSVVLTSSDATQYSFEGNQLTETGPASLRAGPTSLFTRFLIEGLKTGEADLDGDGNITLDELYRYVHDRVIQEQPQQRPKKKEDVEGRILFARNICWELPSHVIDAVSSPYAATKLAALKELRLFNSSGNAIVKQRVLETVRLLTEDDSKSVSNAANQFLSELGPEKGQEREGEERKLRDAEEQARREAEEQARREAEEQARREAEEQARRDAEEQARRDAEEQARREAEEQARRDAEQQARREAKQQARREAKEQVGGAADRHAPSEGEPGHPIAAGDQPPQANVVSIRAPSVDVPSVAEALCLWYESQDLQATMVATQAGLMVQCRTRQALKRAAGLGVLTVTLCAEREDLLVEIRSGKWSKNGRSVKRSRKAWAVAAAAAAGLAIAPVTAAAAGVWATSVAWQQHKLQEQTIAFLRETAPKLVRGAQG